MEVDGMTPWKMTFLYKQKVFHFHVMCSSECKNMVTFKNGDPIHPALRVSRMAMAIRPKSRRGVLLVAGRWGPPWVMACGA